MSVEVRNRWAVAVAAIACAATLFAGDGVPSARNAYGVFPDPAHAPSAIHEKLGPRYVRVEIVWAVSEPRGGIPEFDTENDRKIAAIEAAGMRPFPTIVVGRGWMNGLRWPPEGDVPRSVPPADLSTRLDPNFGHSESYFNFVRAFVRHYQGRFDFIAIENQIDNARQWGGTAAEYLRLLKTASMAIKGVDANIVVTNGGLDSTVWGLVVAKDWLTRGLAKRDDAIDFALQYLNAEQPLGSMPPAYQVRQLVAETLESSTSEFNRTRLPYINSLLDGFSGSVDAINLPYHQDARFLHTVAVWLRDRARRAPSPYTPSILTNDLGITATPDLGCSAADHFSPQELDRHARMLFKRLIAAATADVRPVVVASFETVCLETTFEPYHVDLFDPARPGEPRPSGAAFKRFADATSAMATPRLFAAGPELFAMWYQDDEGRQALLAAWSDVHGGQELPLIVSRSFTSAVITDYAGNSRTIPVVNGDLRVTVTSTPVLVQLLTPLPPLGIDRIEPESGPVDGGTAVRITGRSFASGATVAFGGVPATEVRIVDATTITAVTPRHASGAVDVVVTNPDGATARLTGGFTYLEGPVRRRRAARP